MTPHAMLWTWQAEEARRQLDPSWVQAISRVIERMVEAGKSDQEIWAALSVESLALSPAMLALGDNYIKAYVKCVRWGGADETPRESAPGARMEARGLTERQIRETVKVLRDVLDRTPTRAEVAAKLHHSEPTLKRAMRDLGMGPWPPAPPED